MKFKHLLLIIIFAAGVLVRFYNYPNRITFGPEQAISLITSGRMITQKFSLLGNQNLLRATSSGHSMFAGALFSYSLIPLQLLTNFNALWITTYFTILNLATAIILFLVARKIFNERVAIFTLILFLFSSVSIYHSMFIWNQNYSFLLGTVAIYLLYLISEEEKPIYSLLLGLVMGAAYSFQDLYLFAAIIVYLAVLKLSKQKLRSTLLFILGAALANLPQILFDVRHNFYHLRTNIELFTDILFGRSNGASFSYYHFLIFLPLAIIVGGFMLDKLYLKNRVLAVLPIFLYLYLNLNSPRVNFNAPKGMPAELTLVNINKAAEVIDMDKPDNFNVAVLVDFDSRGHILRYPLEFIYKLKPRDVLDYPSSDELYVYTQNNYDFAGSNVWELSSFDRQNVEKLSDVSENYSVFKLVK